MKITNDGQFSNLYKGNISFPYVAKSVVDSPKPKPDYTVPEKKLTSSSWVTVKKRSKGQRATDSVGASYRLKRIGNFWVDIEKPRESETVKAQKELYNKLKKEYELRQKVREQNKNVLRTTSIQKVHQMNDGVVVNYTKFTNFNGNQFKKLANA